MLNIRNLVGCVVFVSAAASGQILADCEGGPVFPEQIIAADKNTFTWPTATDVEFAKGQIQQVADYVIWARGQLSGTNSLDVSTDHPGPGSGLFYLVKSTGAQCGSWQSVPSSEPGRDTAIRAGCTSVAPSDQQIKDAVNAALLIAPSPWSNADDAMSFHRLLQESLGCAFELFQNTPASSPESAGPPQWNPSNFYCGFGSSSEQPSWANWFPGDVGLLPAGPCLNLACFNHDACYFEHCMGGLCLFSAVTTAFGCDGPLLDDACGIRPSGCLLSDGLLWRPANVAICAIALSFSGNIANPLCVNPPCNSPGQTCHATCGSCCDDGNPCTADSCDAVTGACIFTPIVCDDHNVCTDDVCDATFGCRFTPNETAFCNDGNDCTFFDICESGVCSGIPLDGACNDGNACTSGDTCAGSACNGTPVICNDHDVCTNDSCNPATGCVFTHNTASCDDGDACTTADACSSGVCIGGQPRDCNDQNQCTTDSCNPATGCVNTPISGCSSSSSCLELHGAGFVEVFDAPSLEMSGDFTIEFWANDANGGWFPAVTKWNDYCACRGYFVTVHDYYGVTRFAWSPNGVDMYNLFGPLMPAGEWHHYAAVRNGDAMLLYIDGALGAPATSLVAPVFDNDYSLFFGLGFLYGQGPQYAVGKMDEVRLWTVARSQAEIQANRFALTLPQAGLVGYWTFDEISGAAIDHSGHGNNGVFTGDAARVACSRPQSEGCSDGTREGFGDTDVYPNVAACAGSWSGQIDGTSAAALCAPGWYVCSPGEVAGDHQILAGITYNEARAFDGCFAYNASQDDGMCRPCTGAYYYDDMAAVGASCTGGYYGPGSSSCIGSGRIDADCCSAFLTDHSCRQNTSQPHTGVACCKEQPVPERTNGLATPSTAVPRL